MQNKLFKLTFCILISGVSLTSASAFAQIDAKMPLAKSPDSTLVSVLDGTYATACTWNLPILEKYGKSTKTILTFSENKLHKQVRYYRDSLCLYETTDSPRNEVTGLDYTVTSKTSGGPYSCGQAYRIIYHYINADADACFYLAPKGCVFEDKETLFLSGSFLTDARDACRIDVTEFFAKLG